MFRSLTLGPSFAKTLSTPAGPTKLDAPTDLCSHTKPSVLLQFATHEIPRLRDHCDLLKAALEKSKSRSDALSGELVQERKAHRVLQAQYDALSDAYDDLEQREVYLCATVDDISSARPENYRYLAALDDETRQHAETKTRLSQLVDELIRAQEDLTESRTNLASCKTDLEARLVRVTAERDEAMLIQSALQETVTRGFSERIDELKCELTAAETRANAVESENEQLKAETPTTRTRHLEEKNAALEEQLQTLSNKTTTLQAAQRRMQSEADQYREEVKILKAENDRLREELVESDLENRLKTTEADNKFLKAKLEKAEAERDGLARRLEEQEGEQEKLHTDAQDTLRSYIAEMETLMTECKALKAQTDVLKTQQRVLKAGAHAAVERATMASDAVADMKIEQHCAKLSLLLGDHKPTTFVQKPGDVATAPCAENPFSTVHPVPMSV